ncbi:MAG: methyltransferase domain-containing protein, partial [Gammaproteobacteria bacterium]|nr:methyltransferase domain-containing protein [Gammaproteobacteria bacterium]
LFRLAPRLIVDAGSGTGAAATALRRQFPRARLLAIDLIESPLREARRTQRCWRRYDCLCADVRALPLAAASADLVYSSLLLQHCDDPHAVFAELRRVLRPGGLLLFSTLGPQTLAELREAWAAADERPHVGAFPDMAQLGAALAAAGFTEPVLDRELQRTRHAGTHTLLEGLRALGASHVGRERRRTLTGRARFHAMLARYDAQRGASGVEASWELLYGAAFAGRAHDAVHAHGTMPAPGATEARGESTVPLAKLGRRPAR